LNDVKLIRQNCGLYASFFPGGFVPVVVTCAVKLPTAELNLALKQRMHYRITATSDVTYKMRDHAGTPLLSGSGAGVALRE
jgi:hypothetical protein